MSEAALARVRQIGGWHRYGEAWCDLLHRLEPSPVQTAQ
jgi:hypothetical protein